MYGVKGKRVLVRCLGPGKEHRFFSKDPTRNRLCEECTRSIMESRNSLRVMKTLVTGGNR